MRRDGKKRKPSRAKRNNAEIGLPELGKGRPFIWPVYDRLFYAQEGRCAICQKPADDGYPVVMSLHRDHDHATGLLRGLLCSTCNLREDDSPAWVAYRANPPVAKLGIGPITYGEGVPPGAEKKLRALPGTDGEWFRPLPGPDDPRARPTRRR
jgi:hypothetical protein